MKISLVFLGQTGAGPVYSLEMAKALACELEHNLQVIISENVTNLDAWIRFFDDSTVDFHIIKTYKHTKLSALLNNFNYIRQERLVKLVKDFHADILYLPFGLMWARYVLWRLHAKVKIIQTKHDVVFHDSFLNLSIAELGSFVLNYGCEKYVDGYVILNNKDKQCLETRTGKSIAVIPHASFCYYFDEDRFVDYTIKGRIGFFGRIEVYKGLDLLIEAFEKCSTENLKLLIAGSGTIEKDLLKRIESNEKIDLINRYIKDEEFQPLIDSVDFTVLPYKRASQSGVIPMCFAAGKTVLSTNVGALSEQVPKDIGILVNPDSNDIATAIDMMYSKNNYIEVLGKKAKKYADTYLTWNYSASLLLDFCNRLKDAK